MPYFLDIFFTVLTIEFFFGIFFWIMYQVCTFKYSEADLYYAPYSGFYYIRRR